MQSGWRVGVLAGALGLAGIVAAACSDSEEARQAYLANGNRYFDEQKYPEAIIEYRNAIAEDPRFGEARARLAETYARIGDDRRAYREFIRAADLLPDDHAIQLTAASYLMRAQQLEDALTRVQRVVDADPENVEAQILYGSLMAGLGDLDAGIGQVEEAIQLDPARGMSYVNLAALRIEEGKIDEARTALERAVEIEPTSSRAWLALASFQLGTGAQSEAEASLLRAIELEPGGSLPRRALAALYVATDRAPEAEQHLKALAAASSAPAAQFALADYYTSAGRHEDARAVLRPLLGQGRGSAGVELRLAQIEYRENQVARAHSLLDDLISREPRNLTALVTKTQWLLAEGRASEALSAAREAVKVDPQSVPVQYVLGRALAETHDVDGAVRSFTEVLRLNPRASAADLQLARLNLERGDAELAVRHAGAALRSAPDDKSARLALAAALIARGHLVQAQADVTRLLKEFPKDPAVRSLTARLSVARKDYVRARAEYEEVLRLDARSIDGITGLVTVEMLAGNSARARTAIERHLAAAPEHPELLMLAARVHAETDGAAEAERLLKKLIEVQPDHVVAYGTLGRLYLSQNRLDEALAEFDAVLRRNPRNVAAATMGGMIAELKHDRAAAKDRYRRLVESTPTAAVAANNLAWMYAEDGTNLDAAYDLAQRAIKQLPDRPQVQDTFGWVAYKMGLYTQAVPALERAAAAEPGLAEIQYHLGLAYAKAGQAIKARDTLTAALRLDSTSGLAAEARKTLDDLAALGQ